MSTRLLQHVSRAEVPTPTTHGGAAVTVGHDGPKAHILMTQIPAMNRNVLWLTSPASDPLDILHPKERPKKAAKFAAAIIIGGNAAVQPRSPLHKPDEM
mmetsp:Transcript_98702/g.257857  ORF Transcript_98702/g.257857 Transcript_98702/m.257857 type:complete len:99 (+) Transcript_98702:243-539(+)